jgi:hypothetical protein
MRRGKTILGCCLAASLLAVAACGSGTALTAPARATGSACVHQYGFELSLVSDRGGQPTPVAAALWFSRHGDTTGVPDEGWRLQSRDRDGATLASGQFTLHVIQGPDRTWQVDSGTGCS